MQADLNCTCLDCGWAHSQAMGSWLCRRQIRDHSGNYSGINSINNKLKNKRTWIQNRICTISGLDFCVKKWKKLLASTASNVSGGQMIVVMYRCASSFPETLQLATKAQYKFGRKEMLPRPSAVVVLCYVVVVAPCCGAGAPATRGVDCLCTGDQNF
jgi:hypothetical protein